MSKGGARPKTQNELSKEMKTLNALYTGIRSMEYIRGIGKQTKGSLAQVKFTADFLHPMYSIYADNEDALLLLRDRINFGFFENKTEREKIDYIRNNDAKEVWFELIVGCEIRFLSLGSEFLELLEQDQQILMSGDFIPIKDVYNMVTRKSGKRTMVFRPSIWALENYNETVDEVQCEEYLHLVTGAKTNERPPSTRLFPIKFAGKMVGFCDNIEQNTGGYKAYMDEDFLKIADWFTPSIYKALLQKCIRVGAMNVIHDHHKFSTLDITRTSFLKLMENPGSFVPDLQLFVSGGESAFKRLGIILMEDTFVTPLHRGQHPENIIETLFGAALCFRHFKTGMNKFVPSTELLENVMELCKTAVESTKCYEYDNTNRRLNDNMKLNNRLSIRLIEELRSFGGDILMVKDVVQNNFSRVRQAEYARPENMFVSHCLDQHSITDLAHFFFDPVKPDMSIPEKFKTIWHTTGQNPRRISGFHPDPLVHVAQESLFFAKASKGYKLRTQIPLSHHEIIKHRKLDPSWIAGLIGPLESTISRTNTLSFINPNNIAEIVTIRKPTRDKAVNEITDDIKIAAEGLIQTKLSNNWTNIHEKMIDADFETQFHDGNFVCGDKHGKKGSPEFDWVDFCNGQYRIQCCVETDLVTDVTRHPNLPYMIASSGIMQNGLDLIQDYIFGLDKNILLRIAMYLRPISSTIHLRSISRDGKGTYKDTHWTDSYVFRYLQQLCIWMPSLITTDSTLKFTIHNFPLWQEVRNMILLRASNQSFPHWDGVSLDDTRPLRIHQQEALDSLKDRVNNNKRGHLIWMEPGQGKTFIITSFIGYLVSQDTMPEFCVYTLPKSAFETIRAEIIKSRLPYVVYRKGQAIRPFVINLIEHDTLRTIREDLLSIAPSTFLVIDEMHLLMNDTQRTSVGIELANLASDFIAMTGTLIKDNDAKNVTQWLEIVSDFPITEKNYMIGIAALISRKLDLGIVANHVTISVPMTGHFKNSYELVVDAKFGGTATRTNTGEAFKICHEVLYHALIKRIRDVVHERRPIFVVVKDAATQLRMVRDLPNNLRCFSIDNRQSINLPPDLPPHSPLNELDVIITTPRHSAGYTLTKCNLLITGVYFGNQATREQLVGRILRMGQRSKQVDIETYHTGLLSYTQKHYDSAKAIADSFKGMIKVGEELLGEEHAYGVFVPPQQSLQLTQRPGNKKRSSEAVDRNNKNHKHNDIDNENIRPVKTGKRKEEMIIEDEEEEEEVPVCSHHRRHKKHIIDLDDEDEE